MDCRKIPDYKLRQILEMHNAGSSITAIAKAVQVSRDTIKSYIGVPPVKGVEIVPLEVPADYQPAYLAHYLERYPSRKVVMVQP
jgi:transposase